MQTTTSLGRLRDTLVAILAHEVGHEKRGHIKQGLAISMGYLFVLLLLMGTFLSYEPRLAPPSACRRV